MKKAKYNEIFGNGKKSNEPLQRNDLLESLRKMSPSKKLYLVPVFKIINGKKYHKIFFNGSETTVAESEGFRNLLKIISMEKKGFPQKEQNRVKLPANIDETEMHSFQASESDLFKSNIASVKIAKKLLINLRANRSETAGIEKQEELDEKIAQLEKHLKDVTFQGKLQKSTKNNETKNIDKIRKSLDYFYKELVEVGAAKLKNHFKESITQRFNAFYYNPKPAINWKVVEKKSP